MSIKRSTALHEAAHFVAAYALGRHVGVYSVSVEAQSDYLGLVSGESPEDESADALKDGIVSLYAGFAAMVYADPGSEEYARAGSESDDEMAERFISLLGLPQSETEDELRARAATLVAENWHLVEALATDLLTERTIDGEEAAWVVEVAAGVPEAAEELGEYRRFKRAASALDIGEIPVLSLQKREEGPDAPLPRRPAS